MIRAVTEGLMGAAIALRAWFRTDPVAETSTKSTAEVSGKTSAVFATQCKRQ